MGKSNELRNIKNIYPRLEEGRKGVWRKKEIKEGKHLRFQKLRKNLKPGNQTGAGPGKPGKLDRKTLRSRLGSWCFNAYDRI